MDGFLEYLAPAYALHSPRWKRRFVRLDPAFRALEVFRDDAMLERKRRIRLDGAQVVTADELGGLLFAGDGKQRRAQLSTKISLENSRRFVLRVSEVDAATKRTSHHFLCAEIEGVAAGAVDARASRSYMQQWLHALQQAARGGRSAAELRVEEETLDARALASQIAAFMDQMHLSARVTGRELADKHSVFEITVKAWILQRELVAAAGDGDDGGGSRGRADASCWQVLEYACAWKLRKTSAQLRDFDTQLRQFFQQELRDVAPVPSGSSVSASGALQHLLHSAAHAAAESQRRVTATDAYLQQLLCLPALSAFGSDGSAMLDHFFDITAHFASFRQAEKESGQSMHLRRRKVVPWREREKFERLYQLHQDASHAALEPTDRPKSSKQRHEHHHRSSSKPRHATDRPSQVATPASEPAPAPLEAVRAASLVEEPAVEGVRERMAKIGKKLISEAFAAPPLHSEALAQR